MPFAHEPPSAGFGFRLVWAVAGTLAGDHGHWEALVDATTGALLAFEDRNQYAAATRIVGGVYPLANDGVPPAGVEQPGYPMPFADATNVIVEVMPTSPGATPAARHARWSAAVPLETAITWRAPVISESAASNFATVGPCVSQSSPSWAVTAATSSASTSCLP